MIVIIYLFAILSLVLAFVTLAFVVMGFLGQWYGAPFVPTSSERLRAVLARADLKKGQMLVELGSGDGRVIREAAEKYGVKGVGFEIHPMLVGYSRLRAVMKRLKNIKYRRGNFYKADISKADVIFMFLLPKTLKKLRTKLTEESKKGALIISHGFKIEGFDRYLIDLMDDNYYPTYFYRLKGGGD